MSPIRPLTSLAAALALAALLLVPPAVAAQEHDPAVQRDHVEQLGTDADPAAHGGATNNIFAGDVGNVLWTLVVFLLALFVLGKFAWRPLLGFLEERERFIRGALVEAKQDREAAEQRLRQYEEKLAGARAEATAIVEEARRDAERTRARIEREAAEEASRSLARARREIEIARDTAVRDLYTLSAEMATRIAGRIVERELEPQDHQRLIADAIAELSRLGKAH